MERITNFLFLILLAFLFGCNDSTNQKSFVKYVDYSGMMLTNLNTVSIPDSQVVLDLGQVCFLGDYLRYSRHSQNHQDSNQYYKNECLDDNTLVLRNHLDSVSEKIRNIKVDSLLMESNEIKEIPNWLLKKNIKHLDLSYNKISKVLIPKDCNVESLDLRFNPITEMPEGTFECDHLKRLYLNPNLKKHDVKSDTILVYGKILVFGLGTGDLSDMSIADISYRSSRNLWPKAVKLEKW